MLEGGKMYDNVSHGKSQESFGKILGEYDDERIKGLKMMRIWIFRKRDNPSEMAFIVVNNLGQREKARAFGNNYEFIEEKDIEEVTVDRDDNGVVTNDSMMELYKKTEELKGKYKLLSV